MLQLYWGLNDYSICRFGFLNRRITDKTKYPVSDFTQIRDIYIKEINYIVNVILQELMLRILQRLRHVSKLQ